MVSSVEQESSALKGMEELLSAAILDRNFWQVADFVHVEIHVSIGLFDFEESVAKCVLSSGTKGFSRRSKEAALWRGNMISRP